MLCTFVGSKATKHRRKNYHEMKKQPFTKLAENRDRNGFSMIPVNDIKAGVANGSIEMVQKEYNFGMRGHLYHNRERGNLIFHGANNGRFYAVARFID